jgi:hypothetical protein
MEDSFLQLPPPTTSINDLIQHALKDWKRLSKDHEAFNQFYLYRKLLRRNGGNSKLAVNQFLLDGLRLLQEKYEPEANLLQARYLDGDSIQQIANRMNVSESSIYVLQREAATLLTEAITAHDAQAALTQRELMIARLGGELINEPVGLEKPLAHLQALLIPNAPPERYELALRSRLKELPHVIVIDNLETVTDIETLLPTLQRLANPSKFVVTARENLYGLGNLYHFKVDELSPPYALHLIRDEAANCGLPVLAMSSDAELLPIVETVGGNPLALRLVVGQTHIYGLQSILYDLRQARSQPATNLYTYIYQKAWAKLGALERKALLVMPFAGPDGDDLGYLAEVGDLDLDDLRSALNQLVTLNLVDARGGLNDRRYAIHNLTRTFLLEQVVKWLGK